MKTTIKVSVALYVPEEAYNHLDQLPKMLKDKSYGSCHCLKANFTCEDWLCSRCVLDNPEFAEAFVKKMKQENSK